jgi:hypothetical protein
MNKTVLSKPEAATDTCLCASEINNDFREEWRV